LDEVERLVDLVGFIDAGRLVLMEPLAELHARFRRVEVRVNERGPAPVSKPDWIGVHASSSTVRFVATRYSGLQSDREIAEAFPDASFETFPMTLREIFIAVARQQREIR
jgi:ABC-type multidrug transport system ATPase subunit